MTSMRLWFVAAFLCPFVAVAQGVDATIQWAQRVELALPVSGVVVSVAAEAGDAVKSGQELLKLDPAPFAAEVSDANARSVRAEAELAEAKRALQRSQELFDRGVLASVELDRARLELTRAQSTLASEQAAVARARYRDTHSVLRAPFDAVVIKRNVSVGQSVTSDLQPSVVFVLGESGRYLARAYVDATTATRVKRGESVSVVVAGRNFPGRVSNVGLEPEPGHQESRFRLDALFSSDTGMRVGTPARIDLP